MILDAPPLSLRRVAGAHLFAFRLDVRQIVTPEPAVQSVGANRARYAAEIEPRPSRFTDPAAYTAWAERADRWAENSAVTA